MQTSVNRNFTERLRDVLKIAGKVAKQAGSDTVTPEHIAVGMLREGEGVGATALRFQGIDRAGLEAEIMQHLPVREKRSAADDLSYDGRAVQLVEGAVAEAGELGHSYVGTDHLLLALLRDTAGPTAKILGRRGVGFELARARILWMLAGDPQAPFAPPP
jgi:ATP-dependent Clp protease ATP-binding subunit ClpC